MEIDVLKRKLHPLFKEHKIKKAILCGSLARNEASRHSDLDLILIQDTELRLLDRYGGVLASFSEAFPKRVLTSSYIRPKNWKKFPIGTLSCGH